MSPFRLRLVLASLRPKRYAHDLHEYRRRLRIEWRVLRALARRGEVDLARPRAELLAVGVREAASASQPPSRCRPTGTS